MQEYEQAVFISYAWGGESEEIVNQMDEALAQRGLTIIRDKRDLGYKGSISAFMERIGQGSCIIVVISDKYLRSSNCMFELVEIADGKEFHDRVFPIVLSNAEIYDPVKRLGYVKHWEDKLAELDQAMKEVSQANLQGIREEIDQYSRIRDKVSGLTSILKDMNTLAPDMHRDADFSEIYTGIENRIARASGEIKPESGESPYMGLRYFDTSDADLFFGREALTRELAERVAKENFLAIVGASGSGKSSVARAGLIPAWKGENEKGVVYVITPTAHPLESLAASLTRDSESVTATSTLMDDMSKDSRSLRLYVRKLMSSLDGVNLLLVVDQFEETFTLCKDLDERKAFIENLLSLAEENNSARVVITLRADFYHHCAEYEGLRLTLEKHQAYIGAMTQDELSEAILQPAENNGWDFQPGLVDLILQDIGTEPGALPLLSHALLETWKRRQGRTLTLQGYHEAGGVKKAIAKTAESIYIGFEPENREKMRDIFVRLTRLDTSGQISRDTSRRINIKDLALKNYSTKQIDEFIQKLANTRLLITSSNTFGELEIAVSHEALIRNWPRLRNWLDEDRLSLLVHENLREAASNWDTSDRDNDAIEHRGGKLEDALHLSRNPRINMTTIEIEYLEACQKIETSFISRVGHFISRWLTPFLILLLFTTVVFSYFLIPRIGSLYAALIVAGGIPLMLLTTIYKLDKYKILEFRWLAFCFIGGVISYYIAAQINPGLTKIGFSWDLVIRYFAPIIEEFLKGLILYLILRRVQIARTVDGIIYGIAVGTGFAIIENFEYVSGRPDSAFTIALMRAFSTNLVHMSTVGISGFLFLTARVDKNKATKSIRILLAFAIPTILHSAFNNMVNNGVYSIVAILSGVLMITGVTSVIRKLINEDQKWIEFSLRGNNSFSNTPVNDTQKIITTTRNLFGMVRASQLERLLILQSRRGVLQRLLQDENDPRITIPLEEQLDTVVKKVKGGRVAIGNYCWDTMTVLIPDISVLVNKA